MFTRKPRTLGDVEEVSGKVAEPPATEFGIFDVAFAMPELGSKKYVFRVIALSRDSAIFSACSWMLLIAEKLGEGQDIPAFNDMTVFDVVAGPPPVVVDNVSRFI